MSVARAHLGPAERRRRILDLLREQGSISVVAVEQAFQISTPTARRDLTLLAEQGQARRTHGGAILPGPRSGIESFASRYEQDVPGKHRLAKAVVAGLKPNETIFVDSSSTAYYIVQEILKTGLPTTVLTNSLSVLNVAAQARADRLELIGLGGSLRLAARSFAGAETVRTIQAYFADRVVFSVKGIAPDGSLTDRDPLDAEVKRAMISRARHVILAATPAKFDGGGLSVVAPAAKVDIAYLVDPPPHGVRVLRTAGVEIARA